MWIKTEKYLVMPGEPQLGYVYEPELMYDLQEIKDAVIKHIEDENEVPRYVYFIDDFTEEDIEIEVSEYL